MGQSVACSEGVAVVLDEPQVVPVDDLHHLVQIKRNSQGVGEEDGLCLLRNRRFQLLNVDVVSPEFDVHKYGNQSVLDERGDGGWEAGGHCQDLVAGLESLVAQLGRSQGGDRQQVGR